MKAKITRSDGTVIEVEDASLEEVERLSSPFANIYWPNVPEPMPLYPYPLPHVEPFPVWIGDRTGDTLPQTTTPSTGATPYFGLVCPTANEPK